MYIKYHILILQISKLTKKRFCNPSDLFNKKFLATVLALLPSKAVHQRQNFPFHSKKNPTARKRDMQGKILSLVSAEALRGGGRLVSCITTGVERKIKSKATTHAERANHSSSGFCSK